MAIPLQSLSGTEVLRRGTVNAQSNTNTSLKFDGQIAPTTTAQAGNVVPANHIITILNIVFCELGNASELLHMWIEGPHASGIYLLRNQPIGAYQTFVWADKFSIIGGDSIRVQTQDAANVDIWYNYIDQSWV
jgi:hypothetical protein